MRPVERHLSSLSWFTAIHFSRFLFCSNLGGGWRGGAETRQVVRGRNI